MSILGVASDSKREQIRMYEKSFNAQKHQLPDWQIQTQVISLWELQQTIGKEKNKNKFQVCAP